MMGFPAGLHPIRALTINSPAISPILVFIFVPRFKKEFFRVQPLLLSSDRKTQGRKFIKFEQLLSFLLLSENERVIMQGNLSQTSDAIRLRRTDPRLTANFYRRGHGIIFSFEFLVLSF
jgi:hypothetical protein